VSLSLQNPMPVQDAMPNADYRSAVTAGLWVLAIGFCGFFAWAAFAPLDEGVPAPGVVSVESTRKRIDHLTGGLVERILVREGERVRAGQELIVLDEAQAKAALNAALSQWRIAAATEARLQAERDGLKSISFPKMLTDASSDPEVAAAMRAQAELFRSRRNALEGELRIIQESVRGLELQLRSLGELQAGRGKQVQLFQQQLASYRNLNEQGFVSRNQLLELERQLAEVQSKESETLANMALVNARLAEFRMRGAQRGMEYRREVESQLAEVQRDVTVLGERLAAQRDTFSRLVIRAPVSGTVVDLAFHTVGGVIKAGDRILDIVPEGDELIVEARVAPQYIDRVHAGLPADVHFDAYMSRAERPVIAGKVLVVSADALADSRTGEQYYSMRVAVPAAELEKLGKLELQPGMQGTVMVKTGERSLLVYLARPLLRRFTAAMGEH
jgi:HlyD family type I secretion membrane fusion protein